MTDPDAQNGSDLGDLDLRPAMPLLEVFGDKELARCLSRGAYVHAWIRVEQALIEAQSDAGVIPPDRAREVVLALEKAQIDISVLDQRTRTVGYPILPLIEQLSASSDVVAQYVHWGATTQDIMDTGLVLVLRACLRRIRQLVVSTGNTLAELAEAHRGSLMSARTHARPAVPTTFGAKLAVWLDEFGRHLDRLDALEARLYVVSLHGAGGTSAALGPAASAIRAGVASRLGLSSSEVPWHSSRDVIAEAGFVLAAMATTSGRIAREIVDLSRPEIGEVSEEYSDHRGASSTMPNKANPISSETAVGFSHLASSTLPALLEAMRVEHERSAGEWQIEWDALPTLIAYTGGALLHLGAAISGLVVHEARMRENLDIDGGSIMAEAAMMSLAESIGRSQAHATVYRAVARARTSQVPLAEALRSTFVDAGIKSPDDLEPRMTPAAYVGNVGAQVDDARRRWTKRTSRGASARD
jgi:3-carboxy-cis,cis-muconate cycloisomerase